MLRTPKKREALPDVLDRRELSRLLVAPGKDGVWRRPHAGKVERDRLLLALFAYGSLRRTELLALDCEDVDLDRLVVRVRKAKGGRQRVPSPRPALLAPKAVILGVAPLMISAQHIKKHASNETPKPREQCNRQSFAKRASNNEFNGNHKPDHAKEQYR